ncbi:MAG: amidase family protein, partial [Thermodesulfobacteriota bacterium]|nr:amidase family protein [Thermodesulfobacteriota bacterium]
MELYTLTIHELHQLLSNGEVTSQEATESVINRIESVDDKVNAYISITGDLARGQAKLADKLISQGSCSPLTGIPLAV